MAEIVVPGRSGKEYTTQMPVKYQRDKKLGYEVPMPAAEQGGFTGGGVIVPDYTGQAAFSDLGAGLHGPGAVMINPRTNRILPSTGRPQVHTTEMETFTPPGEFWKADTTISDAEKLAIRQSATSKGLPDVVAERIIQTREGVPQSGIAEHLARVRGGGAQSLKPTNYWSEPFTNAEKLAIRQSDIPNAMAERIVRTHETPASMEPLTNAEKLAIRQSDIPNAMAERIIKTHGSPSSSGSTSYWSDSLTGPHIDTRPSASVMVYDSNTGRVLTVQTTYGANRKGALSTPGGLIDDGEDAVTAAVREAFEETGIRAEAIGPIVHDLKSNHIIVAARYKGGELDIPNIMKNSHGEIQDAKWVPLEELKDHPLAFPEHDTKAAQQLQQIIETGEVPSAPEYINKPFLVTAEETGQRTGGLDDFVSNVPTDPKANLKKYRVGIGGRLRTADGIKPLEVWDEPLNRREVLGIWWNVLTKQWIRDPFGRSIVPVAPRRLSKEAQEAVYDATGVALRTLNNLPAGTPGRQARQAIGKALDDLQQIHPERGTIRDSRGAIMDEVLDHRTDPNFIADAATTQAKDRIRARRQRVAKQESQLQITQESPREYAARMIQGGEKPVDFFGQVHVAGGSDDVARRARAGEDAFDDVPVSEDVAIDLYEASSVARRAANQVPAGASPTEQANAIIYAMRDLVRGTDHDSAMEQVHLAILDAIRKNPNITVDELVDVARTRLRQVRTQHQQQLDELRTQLADEHAQHRDIMPSRGRRDDDYYRHQDYDDVAVHRVTPVPTSQVAGGIFATATERVETRPSEAMSAQAQRASSAAPSSQDASRVQQGAAPTPVERPGIPRISGTPTAPRSPSQFRSLGRSAGRPDTSRITTTRGTPGRLDTPRIPTVPTAPAGRPDTPRIPTTPMEGPGAPRIPTTPGTPGRLDTSRIPTTPGDVPRIPTTPGDVPRIPTTPGDVPRIPTTPGDVPRIPTTPEDVPRIPTVPTTPTTGTPGTPTTPYPPPTFPGQVPQQFPEIHPDERPPPPGTPPTGVPKRLKKPHEPIEVEKEGEGEFVTRAKYMTLVQTDIDLHTGETNSDLLGISPVNLKFDDDLPPPQRVLALRNLDIDTSGTVPEVKQVIRREHIINDRGSTNRAPRAYRRNAPRGQKGIRML